MGAAAAFIVTSLALTIIAAQNASGSSVLDRITDRPGPEEAPAAPATADDGCCRRPGDDAPLTPPRTDHKCG